MHPFTFTDSPQGIVGIQVRALSTGVWTVSCGLSAPDVCFCLFVCLCVGVCWGRGVVYCICFMKHFTPQWGSKCTFASTWCILWNHISRDFTQSYSFSNTSKVSLWQKFYFVIQQVYFNHIDRCLFLLFFKIRQTDKKTNLLFQKLFQQNLLLQSLPYQLTMNRRVIGKKNVSLLISFFFTKQFTAAFVPNTCKLKKKIIAQDFYYWKSLHLLLMSGLLVGWVTKILFSIINSYKKRQTGSHSTELVINECVKADENQQQKLQPVILYCVQMFIILIPHCFTELLFNQPICVMWWTRTEERVH